MPCSRSPSLSSPPSGIRCSTDYPSVMVLAPPERTLTTPRTAGTALAHFMGASVHLRRLLREPRESLTENPYLASHLQAICHARKACAREDTRQWLSWLSAFGYHGSVEPIDAPFADALRIAVSDARMSDLTVLCRPAIRTERHCAHRCLVALLAQSGRPVLIVSEGRDLALPARRVMIAWANTRESARALNDAAPFLQCADRIEWVTVGLSLAEQHDVERVKDRWAARLGTTGPSCIVTHLPRRRGPVHHTLREHAHQTRAGLIVAGGYGHHWLREWLCGGTTRGLFFETTTPVLFSH